MCGIVAYAGLKNAVTVVIEGLKRLEYRGYDSAGVAYFSQNHPQISCVEKRPGYVQEVQKLVLEKDVISNVTIGHTRWATHGQANYENAHPIKCGKVSIVHNGIIENYQPLKEKLQKDGCDFKSSTDTEVIAHFLDTLLKKHEPLDALSRLGEYLKGSYALAIMLDGDTNKIYFAKKFSPLLLGKDADGYQLASDQYAFLSGVKEYLTLEDASFGFISKGEAQIFSMLDNKPLPCDFSPRKEGVCSYELGGYSHYMHKEIHETPLAIKRLLVGFKKQNLDYEALSQRVKTIHIVACGSSLYAGMAAKDYFETYLKIPVFVEVASEYRYKNVIINDSTLVIGISQSGETADTIAAIKKASESTELILGVLNKEDSSLAEFCNGFLGNIFLHAGMEVSVASTKAFVVQLLALKLMALSWGKSQGEFVDSKYYDDAINDIHMLPFGLEKLFKSEKNIQNMAVELLKEQKMIFIARGGLYPIALEGALKVKELSYIFAEGYPAGELKHGPIATIENSTPVIALFCEDGLKVKTLNSVHEVKARGARVFSITPDNFQDVISESDGIVGFQEGTSFSAVIFSAVIVQLLAYHLACLKDLNVDKPRNLAKSVTVE